MGVALVVIFVVVMVLAAISTTRGRRAARARGLSPRCPHCGARMKGDGHGGWMTVCRKCGRDQLAA